MFSPPANLVSGNYFSVLGAQPFLARAITPEDDATPGTGAVVILSYHFWQQFLSEDPASRQREVATRLALGSSRFSILRQSLIETLILAPLGGSLGLALAFAATRALIAFVARDGAYTALSPIHDFSFLLCTFGQWSSTITVLGYTPAPKEDTTSILNRVSGRYFETTATPILSGRALANTDSTTSLKVMVVNQTLARHFFPKGDALGRSIKINIPSVEGPWQIVGIPRDAKVRGPRHASQVNPMQALRCD